MAPPRPAAIAWLCGFVSCYFLVQQLDVASSGNVEAFRQRFAAADNAMDVEATPPDASEDHDVQWNGTEDDWRDWCAPEQFPLSPLPFFSFPSPSPPGSLVSCSLCSLLFAYLSPGQQAVVVALLLSSTPSQFLACKWQ